MVESATTSVRHTRRSLQTCARSNGQRSQYAHARRRRFRVNLKSWLQALKRACVSGSVASVTSTVALLAMGARDCQSAYAPVNAISHWIWGERAIGRQRPTWQYTVLGYFIHHAMSIMWATHYEKWLGAGALRRAGNQSVTPLRRYSAGESSPPLRGSQLALPRPVTARMTDISAGLRPYDEVAVDDIDVALKAPLGEAMAAAESSPSVTHGTRAYRVKARASEEALFNTRHTARNRRRPGAYANQAQDVATPQRRDNRVSYRRGAWAEAGAVVAAAGVVSALACFVDLRCTPRRLTPGFERRLGPSSLWVVYVAFGVGLAVCGRRRRSSRR